MKYQPNPELSDSERLIVIETLLVNALDEQDSQRQDICRIKRILWVALGFVAASLGTSGMAWAQVLNGT